jgi:light-regulated signal transduction histidine kinase (bacteriophytochrome)
VEVNLKRAFIGGEDRLLAVVSDIHQRKLTELELETHRKHLEELVDQRTAEIQAKNKELETFTYSVSHDLKAPLRGIDGYSRLLLEEYADSLDDEGQTFLGNVRKSAEQMNQLIEDLLVYSRMERRGIHTAMVELAPLVEMLIFERQQDIESRRIKIIRNIPFESVAADVDMMRQVIGNYLDNAIKFSKPDRESPLVEISGYENDAAWTLSVKDNGIGFDPQYHDRIFEIFHRLHRVEDFPGTGVGLAIVRKAVERIGGRVWAQSDLGKGATFFVKIPKTGIENGSGGV